MVLNKLVLSIFLLVNVFVLSSCQSIKDGNGVVSHHVSPDGRSDSLPKQTASLVKEVNINTYDSHDAVSSNYNPLEVVNEVAQKELVAWNDRPSKVPVFTQKRPRKPVLPVAILLKKDEFETTQSFQNRVITHEQKRLNAVNTIEKNYQNSIEHYNNNVRNHNQAIINEKKNREDAFTQKYWDFVNKNLNSVLGEPIITMNRYNADEQVFYAILGSSKSNLRQWIKVFVPNNKAKLFKRNSNNATPVLSLDKNINEKLVISSVVIEVGGTQYESSFINKPIFTAQEHIIRSKEITVPGNYLSIN